MKNNNSKKNGVVKALPGGTGRCYESHPPLTIDGHQIYGGSCISPVVTDADIYVGFDYSMKKSSKQYPWEGGESFLYSITDMNAPSDPDSFLKLITWLELQLIANKKIHMGCIGGHGRTGLVLAALVKHMTGNADAITYVRGNYCRKAVESSAQIEFLHKHFGIKQVEPAKDGFHSFGSGGSYSGGTYGGRLTRPKDDGVPAPEMGRSKYFITPVKSPTSVWGDEVILDKLLKLVTI